MFQAIFKIESATARTKNMSDKASRLKTLTRHVKAATDATVDDEFGDYTNQFFWGDSHISQSVMGTMGSPIWTNQYSGMTEGFLNTAQIVQIPKFLGDILDLDRGIESGLYACCWNHTFLSATVVD